VADFDVYCGLDVGKGEHHGVALDRAGKRLYDAALPNDEQRLRALFDRLGRHGRVLVVVDQPATIGALPVTVARASGVEVAYLPGLAMRRIADQHPGKAKTDARDAFVIADAARTLPHTLRRVDVGDDALAELEVLVGYDDDLAQESTRLINRIRGLLTHIHPALERHRPEAAQGGSSQAHRHGCGERAPRRRWLGRGGHVGSG
jgi:transposase